MVGDMLRVDGQLSRTGIQIYDQGDGTKRREYRPPDEVFDSASLESLRAIPVTDLHPPGLVTPSNRDLFQKGHVGDDVRKADDDHHVAATVWVHDSELIGKIQKKERRELSVGYTAKIDLAEGKTPDGERYDAVQRRIRGNHLAVGPKGWARGGETVSLRLDSKGDQIYPVDSAEEIGDNGARMKFTVKVDGRSFTVEAENDDLVSAIDVVEKRADAATQERDEAIADRDAAQARADGAEAERDQAKADLTEATTPEKLEELSEARADLVTKAKKLGGDDIDLSGSDTEIRRRALEKASVEIPEDKLDSDAYIEARFDAAFEKEPVKDSVKSRLDGKNRGTPGKRSIAEQARKRYLQRMEG